MKKGGRRKKLSRGFVVEIKRISENWINNAENGKCQGLGGILRRKIKGKRRNFETNWGKFLDVICCENFNEKIKLPRGFCYHTKSEGFLWDFIEIWIYPEGCSTPKSWNPVPGSTPTSDSYLLKLFTTNLKFST